MIHSEQAELVADRLLGRNREEELDNIAGQIFEALSSERFEPSERGAGWAPTDKGYDAVIEILRRCGARRMEC
jgi:hypothetical protein